MEVLVGYDSRIIYQVYVKNQNQKNVIKMKDFYIFEGLQDKNIYGAS